MAYQKENNKKVYTVDEAWDRITRYCALQDRCQKEVLEKLHGMLTSSDVIDELLIRLIEQKFVDEERYARSYVRGKFRMKKWGRVKIRQGLFLKSVSAYCIKKGLEEIEEADYLNTISEVLQKKNERIVEENPYKRKQKLLQYMASRGFESHYIYDAIDEL